MAPPETRYALNGNVRIAYQIVGDGALELIVVPGLVSHLDLTWEEPAHAAFCRALAKFSRLILFDKRGTGLSDPEHGVAGLERAGMEFQDGHRQGPGGRYRGLPNGGVGRLRPRSADGVRRAVQ